MRARTRVTTAMDFETMRRLRESDPAKFTDIGRSKNKGGVRLAGVNPGGQQVPNARLASEVRAGTPPADDPLARIPGYYETCLLYTSPSPRDQRGSRMPSSA